MLSISGSNSRKSAADWTLVNIHYFYKEEWICVSISDSLLVSLICQRNLQIDKNITVTNVTIGMRADVIVSHKDNMYMDFLKNTFVLFHKRQEFS